MKGIVTLDFKLYLIMRIYAISDLHMDFEQNWILVEQLSDQDYKNDVLLIAGDISHNLYMGVYSKNIHKKM